MQERLDGRLVVSYRGVILTPGKAPPLADFLRAQTDVTPATLPSEQEVPECEVEVREPQRRVIWYEDSEMKRICRELVRTGMQRARQEGKLLGRPRVTERPEFTERFAAVTEQVTLGIVSRRQAAKELDIGYATFKRLLDARSQPPAPVTNDTPLIGVPSG